MNYLVLLKGIIRGWSVWGVTPNKPLIGSRILRPNSFGSEAPGLIDRQGRTNFSIRSEIKDLNRPASGERKGFMPAVKQTFINELQDLYDAERQLLKSLPRMAKAAKNEALKAVFELHETETETHVGRLEKVFEIFGEKCSGKRCKGMQGLLEESKGLIEEEWGDLALICSAQKVEHYEISSYSSLVSWAKLLNEAQAVDLLEDTLEEEKATDEKLTGIAEEPSETEKSDAPVVSQS
jgi:ferritin-like metal-binding protein YciE